MSFKVTPLLAQVMLAAIKTQLDAGFIYIYSGSVPADASEALDMATDHTELAKISVSGGGTGLTFESATGALIVKETTETWSGLLDFDGTNPGAGTQTQTFFRFCKAGDDGRDDGVTNSRYRIQGTCGGPTGSADMTLGSDTLTDNGSNTTAIATFRVNLLSLV